MATKQQILDEIARTAGENGGKPLGKRTFEKATGLTEYDWSRFWARFGDAQLEAGYQPNTLQVPYSEKFLFDFVIALSRRVGRFPTLREMSVESASSAESPSKNTFKNRFGSKADLAQKISEYCSGRDGFEDVVEMCSAVVVPKRATQHSLEIEGSGLRVGWVYLGKSGKYYKIGKTWDLVRRPQEIKLVLAEKFEIIHDIETDDPAGVEVYWHKRFAAKRKSGEWFDLHSSDVQAFKRWRRIC